MCTFTGGRRGHQIADAGGSSMGSAPSKGSLWALTCSTDASACPLPGIWQHYSGRKAAAAEAATAAVQDTVRTVSGPVASIPENLNDKCREDGKSISPSQVLPSLLPMRMEIDRCKHALHGKALGCAQAPLTERQKLTAERVSALREELHAAEAVVANLKQWLLDAERDHDNAMATSR